MLFGVSVQTSKPTSSKASHVKAFLCPTSTWTLLGLSGWGGNPGES